MCGFDLKTATFKINLWSSDGREHYETEHGVYSASSEIR